jgi:hypothetical protein
MVAADFVAYSTPPGYVMLNSLKDFRHFPDCCCCYCTCYHKIMLCLHWSLVHRALHLHPEKEIQWWQVSGVRGPGCWASTSNLSVAKGFIQILTDNISEVYQGAIMLEPHFTTDFQGYRFQQLG